MCQYMYVYRCTYTYIYIYIHTNVCVHVRKYVCMNVYVYMYMYQDMQLYRTVSILYIGIISREREIEDLNSYQYNFESCLRCQILHFVLRIRDHSVGSYIWGLYQYLKELRELKAVPAKRKVSVRAPAA